ncbi:hypothetical protein LTR08_006677 [Meristemomyces frigidus]|nr:hypothetical protein LTR08_006677 [Meristemomyces frigidus]
MAAKRLAFDQALPIRNHEHEHEHTDVDVRSEAEPVSRAVTPDTTPVDTAAETGLWSEEESDKDSEDTESEECEEGNGNDDTIFSNAGNAEERVPQNSSQVRRETAVLSMRKRLGGLDISDYLDRSLQPKEQIMGKWVPKAPVTWKRELLQALQKLVWHHVTMKEVNDILLQTVTDRLTREKKYGERFEQVRVDEVREAMDYFRSEGRTMADPDA